MQQQLEEGVFSPLSWSGTWDMGGLWLLSLRMEGWVTVPCCYWFFSLGDQAGNKCTEQHGQQGVGTWSGPYLPGLWFHKQGPELLQVDVGKGNSLRKGSSQEGGRAELPETANGKRKRGAGGCGKPGGLGRTSSAGSSPLT